MRGDRPGGVNVRPGFPRTPGVVVSATVRYGADMNSVQVPTFRDHLAGRLTVFSEPGNHAGIIDGIGPAPGTR